MGDAFSAEVQNGIRRVQTICQEKSALLVIRNDPSAQAAIDAAGSLFGDVEIVHSALEALRRYERGRFDLIYLDPDLPDMSGAEVAETIKKVDDEQPFAVFVSAEDTRFVYRLIRLNLCTFIAKPIAIENFVRITLYTIRGFTELHEQLSLQQQKMVQTGELISMIAHQWRQPLSAITTIIGTLRTRLSLDFYHKSADPFNALERDLDGAFGKIEESATFLSKTVNDFRNFYRPNNLPTEFNVAEIIERVCRMVLMDKALHNIELTLNLDRSILLNTFESELMQVLINLLNNSRDAIQEKKVKNPKISISLTQGESEVYLNILDNAKGIAQEVREKIFLPYFSTKTQKNGTGIGLHMSKTIIENHLKGSITVTNDPLFGGADFCITLPKKNTGGSL